MAVRMFLSDGSAIYPALLSKEQRERLKPYLDSGKLSLVCGCNVDRNLSYGIDSLLRIVPRHKLYEHEPFCDRNTNAKSAFVYDEFGGVVAHLSFNCADFSIPTETSKSGSKSSKGGVSSDDDYAEKVVYKLPQLVKAINRDTYMDRLMSGKALLSWDYFNSCVVSRLKKIRPNGKGKMLSEFKVDVDGFAFFYGKLEKIYEKSVTLRFANGYAKNYYAPTSVLEREFRAFEGRYGISVDEAIKSQNLGISGFLYKRFSKAGNEYICAGRIHIFLVNNNGLYCDSIFEREFLDNMLTIVRKKGGSFYFPDCEESTYDGIYMRNGKSTTIYYGVGFDDGFCCNGDSGAINTILEKTF